MTYVALVTILILIQYIFFVMQTGMARGKDTVVAPATTGDELYERKSRVQMNTLEQLIITIPAMWICGIYFRADVAAILGLIFLVGRFIFSAAYINEPASRSKGMIIGFLANMALLVCCLITAITHLF